MKRTLFTVDEREFAFSKGFFGKERIYLDGEQVSEKISIGGATHNFNIHNEDFQRRSVYRTFNLKNIELQLKKNGKRMDSVTAETKNVLIVQMALEAFLGIAFYQLLLYFFE